MKIGPRTGALPGSAEQPDTSETNHSTSAGESSQSTESSQQETSTVEKGLPSLDTVTRVGATSAAAVMVGGGVAAGAIVASQPPVDKSSFDHILIRDKPINEIPILMQHNAGNVPGSGSVPFVGENQTMGIGDVLDKTPVRGFELDLHTFEGETVINHGGFFNPLVDEHPKVEDALAPIDEWLSQSKNNDEVVYIMLESYVGNDGTEDVFSQMESAFGDKIYTPEDHIDFMNANGRWPTAEELTAEGPRVIVISNNGGTAGGTAFGQGYIFKEFDHTWEDRSPIGLLGEDFHDEIVPKIDTERMDELVEQGGLIKLDQISADDPRFFKPEDRDELAARPDVSVGETFYISDETVKSIMFGIGVASATGAATFGIASSVVEAVSHESKIRQAGAGLRARVASTEMADVLSHRAKEEISPDIEITENEIVEHCRDAMVWDITWSTLKAGAFGTLSIAGSFLSFAMLFPPVFPILSGLAIATLGAGAVSTTVATVVNRRRMQAKLDEAMGWESVAKSITNKQGAIQEEIGKSDEDLLHQKLEAKSQTNRLRDISGKLLATTLILRVSAMGKHSIKFIGRISWIATSAVMFITTIVDAVTNYKTRQAKLENIGKAASESVLPAMDKRPYLFFGKSPFERWIVQNQSMVGSKLGLGKDATLKNILNTLQKPERENAFKAFRELSTMDALKKPLRKHAEKMKRSDPFAAGNEADLREVLEDYTVQEVGRAARKDTFRSGAVNTLKIAAVAASFGFLFPPVTGFVVIAAAAAIPFGLIVSRLVGGREERKFKQVLKESMETERGNKPRTTAQESMHEEYATKLQSFLGYLTRGTMQIDKKMAELSMPAPSSTSAVSQNRATTPNAPQAKSPLQPKVAQVPQRAVAKPVPKPTASVSNRPRNQLMNKPESLRKAPAVPGAPGDLARELKDLKLPGK